MVTEINRLRKANESLGGSFEVSAFGLVPGLGSHISWEERLDGQLAGAVASIQSVKGVAIGEAWDVAGRPGSEAHDEIFWSADRGYHRETNHAGGLEGGMTNGLPLSVRAAIKPISTLTKPLRSVDTESKEPALACELLDAAEGGAIALGGGSVLSPAVREALGRHTVVWLQVDPDVAWRRVEGAGRPLARDGAGFEALLEERLSLYESLADVIVMPSECDAVERALPALRALADLPAGTKMLWAASASGEYPVVVGRGLLGAGWWPLEGRRFCVSDRVVCELYGERIESV